MLPIDFRKYNEGKYRYILNAPFEIETHISSGELIDHPYMRLTAGGHLTVKKDYAWDGATGVFSAFQTRDFVVPSLVHDALTQMIGEGLLPMSKREDADKLLRKLCLSEGMHPFRAWYVYQAVRLFVRIKY